MFGCHIGRFERRGDERMSRGGADDAAPFARLHAGDRGGDRMESGGEIDGDDHVPGVGWKFLYRRYMLHPGVVNENVDRTELHFRLLYHGANLIWLGHIG